MTSASPGADSKPPRRGAAARQHPPGAPPVAGDSRLAVLVRCVDALEAAAESYVTLDDVRRRCGGAALETAPSAAGSDVVQAALEEDLLLVDERRRLDGTSGEPRSVTLCRLNRRHPLVRQLLAW